MCVSLLFLIDTCPHSYSRYFLYYAIHLYRTRVLILYLYHCKYPPKHQPVVPDGMVLPSLSRASFCTSTCTQLAVMPSIVSSLPAASTFTRVPTRIVVIIALDVSSSSLSRRFSDTRYMPFTAICCKACSMFSYSQLPSACRGQDTFERSFESTRIQFSICVQASGVVRIRVFHTAAESWDLHIQTQSFSYNRFHLNTFSAQYTPAYSQKLLQGMQKNQPR